MATAQQQDDKVQSYHTTTSSLKLEDIPFGDQGTTLLCGQARHIVPYCTLLVGNARCLTRYMACPIHICTRTIKKPITSKFVRKGTQKQVGIWGKECIMCQSSKVQTHIKSPLEKFNIPHCFDHIHVDLPIGTVAPLERVYSPAHGVRQILSLARGNSPQLYPLCQQLWFFIGSPGSAYHYYTCRLIEVHSSRPKSARPFLIC